MNEHDLDDEQQFAQQLKETLDQQLQDMDAASVSKLRQAREKALAKARRGKPMANWIAAPVAASVVIISLLLFIVPRQQVEIGNEWLAQAEAFDDMTMLVEADELELYEGLDFLIWLDEQGYAS